MFDFVRKHTKLLQVLLFLLIFPSFVLFGIQGYDSFNNNGSLAAKVDGLPISMQQLDDAQRSEIARLQQSLGASADIKSLDTPEAKLRTLDGLIRQTLLQVAVRKQHLTVSDSQVQQAILQIPQIAALRKPDGSFDVEAYRQLVAAQGMTTAQFEDQVREQLLLQQAVGGIAQPVIESKAIAGQLYDWQHQKRQVRLALFNAQDYVSRVQPSDAQIAAFYNDHTTLFQSPQRADIQYVVLSLSAVRQGIVITPAQAQAYYTQHIAEFSTPQERKASHILITLPPNPTSAQVQAAKAKADAILAEVRKDPARFAEIARRDSQDPGSAAQGGNLGYFAQNAMVKPFADAVFAMKKVGDIVGPVQSPYGFHIIELTGIKPAEQKPFAQVQSSIQAQLQNQEALKRFPEMSDKFSNLVYEDSRSFTQVAARYHLQVQTAENVSPTPKAPSDRTTDPLENAAFLKAVFSSNSIRDKRNIAAVEIAPNTLASARILQYQPAATLTFAQAQDKVRALLVAQQAAALAVKAGEQALAAAQQGKAMPAWSAPVDISQSQTTPPPGVPAAAVTAAFQLPVAKLPVLDGLTLPGQAGYAIVSVDSVSKAKPDAEQLRAQQGTMSQLLSQGVSEAYINSLKKRYGVEILYKVAPPANS